LPKLCDPNGTNRLNASGHNASFYRFGTCKFGYDENSAQEQLQTYIANALEICVDFSVFENIGYNVTVINDPDSTVTFSNKYFVANVSYPFKVKLGRSMITIDQGFELKKNIRLKQVYEYAQALIEQEYKDIHFNIENDFRNPFLGWDTKISLVRQVNPCIDCEAGKFDDIFQIVDNESLIRGHPLVFQFAVKNRAPVLDWIDFGQRYNVVVKEGREIVINPFGKDPDENIVFYNYSGWMEHFNSTFDEIGCSQDYEACVVNPALYVENQNFVVRNWSSSELYRETGRNASYRTSRKDIGLHHTLVHVVDDQGLEDYQNVSIMVYDVPIAVPSGRNIYENIGNRNASKEDPYILDAKALSYFTGVLEFEWRDEWEGYLNRTDKNETPIPDPVNIEDINTKNFTKVGTHNITLSLKYFDEYDGVQWTTPTMMLVEVHQCLPHRNPNTAPYPYHYIETIDSYDDQIKVENNPFLADHTCCNDNYEITDGNICYYFEEYGSYKSLNDLSVDGRFSEIPFPDVNYNINNPNYIVDESDNDIWMRNFTRRCDGTRGNICQGDRAQEVINITGCDDFTLDMPDERCSGPPIQNPDFSIEFSINNPGCAEYDETTFEAEFQGGTGSCNYTEVCSTLGNGGFGTGGDYFCNATCDGFGDCDKTILDVNFCDDCTLLEENANDAEENSQTCNNNGDCPERATPCYGSKEGRCDIGGCYQQTQTTNIETCPNDCSSFDCVFNEYYPTNVHPDTRNRKETCFLKEYNPDVTQRTCETCGQIWTAGGQGTIGGTGTGRGDLNEGYCCGDDANEYYLSYGGTSACCDETSDCVFNGICYEDGDGENVDADPAEESCNTGVWW